jgi:hypothetical protein
VVGGCIKCLEFCLQVGGRERGVDRLDPRSYESEIFRGRELQSSGPRASRNAVEAARCGHVDADRAWCILVGGVLVRFRGFRGVDSSGVCFF